MTALAKLREFAREKPAVERCELCGAALGTRHSHLAEPAIRRLLCACEPCAILFSGRGLSSKYARVPRDGRFLGHFQMSDAEWDGLMIPINLAFFFHSTPAGKVVAIYPSPAGATESLLSLEAWNRIAENNPRLASMEPDVEALLVNRVSETREYYIAPMDQCFKLVGLIRAHWRGFSGGSEVWEKIDGFFAALKEQSRA
ncbi:MAG: DUF5947 family protein [Acidobacteriota bacterium]|nr:DUF5947 family protein [Acidobacteriota bacterium]